MVLKLVQLLNMRKQKGNGNFWTAGWRNFHGWNWTSQTQLCSAQPVGVRMPKLTKTAHLSRELVSLIFRYHSLISYKLIKLLKVFSLSNEFNLGGDIKTQNVFLFNEIS